MSCHDVLYTGAFLTLLYNDYVGVADAENLHDGVEGNASGMLGGPQEKNSLWSLAFLLLLWGGSQNCGPLLVMAYIRSPDT